MNVLIVDDDVLRRESLSQYLLNAIPETIDEVAFAGTSDEAKNIVRSRYYDAMIVDVVLPKRKGDSPSSSVGLALVGQLHRGRLLKKPEKVLAITAYEDDIHHFRGEFEEYCTAVIRASGPSDQWRRRICDALSYVSGSKVSRVMHSGRTAVITVHGIRTYGAWQSRFAKLIQQSTDEVELFTYKYGYFSTAALLFPPLRAREVGRLHDRVRLLFDPVPKRVFVFCHSFGTYLAAETLRKLVSDSDLDFELTLVLSGSVLNENYDWSFARQSQNISIVNDCGSSDHILSLSKIGVIGLGMAGKVGFSGFNDDRHMNRWFSGGHSHYFDGDEFMRKNWLPLVVGGRARAIDNRGDPRTIDIFIDGVSRLLGGFKMGIYGGIFCLAMIICIWFFW